VPLPFSRTKIQQLGERLATGTDSEEDRQVLEELVACHQTTLESGRPRLDGLEVAAGTSPLVISGRPKTTTTIIEKLQREDGMSLPRMQDLAGFRIVGAISLAGQDRLAEEIVLRFPADPRSPKLIDRRADPRSGYRALHVVTCLDGVSIEVQVRTLYQHVWADMMEYLADRLGRQIRYGQPPIPPEGVSQRQADLIVEAMMRLSAGFAEREAQGEHGNWLVTNLAQDLEETREMLLDELRKTGIDL